MSRISHTIYLHRNADELSDLWDPGAPQQEEYDRVAYEVALQGELDLDTGKFYLQSVGGVPLVKETQI